jgi:hypothetical protein
VKQTAKKFVFMVEDTPIPIPPINEKMEQKLRRDRRIGDNSRALRDKHDISQEKLCAELQRRGCDIARSCYAKYESGELNVRISVLLELKKITTAPTKISLKAWTLQRRNPHPYAWERIRSMRCLHSYLFS